MGPDPEAVVIAVEHVQVAGVVVKRGRREAVADIVGCVVVHTVEVVATFDKGDFFRCERR